MKTTTSKKKSNRQDSNPVEDIKITEAPKNLLPEHIEANVEAPIIKSVEEISSVENTPDSAQIKTAGKSSPPEVKENTVEVKQAEEKPVIEQKVDLPTVESNINEVKYDDVVPASGVNLSQPPPPPISVPVNQIDLSTSSNQPSNKKFLLAGIVVLLALILGGSWFYFSKNSKKTGKKVEALILVKPTISNVPPTKTASEEIKLNKYPIQILNGSGITGEATKMKDILEKEGFKVNGTGNADNYEYANTIVKTNKDIEKSFLEKLKSLIGKTYILGQDELSSSLESSGIIVIVGSGKINQ